MSPTESSIPSPAFLPQNEPIAIVGSGCRFPGGASSPSKLWELLRDPRDVLSEIASRFDQRGFYHPDHQFPGHSNVRHSYLLEENVAHFDAQFFNLKAAEASAMDPQQRILLETVYEGLEAAGMTIEGLKGSDTGVYVGMMYGDYESMQYRDLQSIPTYHGTGIARSMVSNRISYFFDWHGPSLTVDTACSSSLVALHQAVQALRAGEVHVAVAAGTNLLLGPEPYIYESSLQMLSPDGRSRMWGDDANGYARGDGVGAIVLKTLRQALADGDHVECVIRQTGVNQDGRSPGITMPTAKAQAALIRDVYARAGLDLTSKTDRCQYIEAHGTGTPAGDPVEAEAIHTAFFGDLDDEGTPKNDEDKLLVGSIKTVIGHTESTAGIAAILKVVQAMKHGYIPPNGNQMLDGKRLDFKLNPRVQPWYKQLRLCHQLTPWPQLPPGQCRRASVNSFGFGGTNAHVILESISNGIDSEVPHAREDNLFAPFVFSAQSKQSLLASLTAHAAFLEQHPDTNPTDLAWTLRSRRSRLPLRVAFPASSIPVLRSSLQDLASSDSSKLQLDPRLKLAATSTATSSHTRQARLLGIFTGQGAQWARMGAELIETSKYASDILAGLDDVLANLANEQDRPKWTLRQEILADASTSKVANAAVSQPLCTAVQVILVDLLRLAGIRFVAVVGHSSGEIAAAYAAGHLSARDAICIAYYRGLHSTRLAGGLNGVQGAMLAVGTSFEDAEEVCNDEAFKGRVKVAACNSPSSVTLSGDEDAIEEMAELFEDEEKSVRRLKVDKAYHSHHMIPCSQPYLDSMLNLKTVSESESESFTPTKDSGCTWVSSVVVKSEMAKMNVDASYWVDNLLSPVLFKQAVERAVSELGPFDGAIEVGPHPALKGPVRQTLQDLKVDLMPYTGLLQRGSDANLSMSIALGYLWTHLDNLAIDFDRYEGALGGIRSCKYHFISDLPVYQWNHSHSKGYWHESNVSRNLRNRNHPVHPLLGDLSPHSSSKQLMWKTILRAQDLPWVHDHKIQGQSVFPAAGYAVTALETAPFLAAGKPIQLVEIEDLAIHQAMVFENNSESEIEVQFSVIHINRDDNPGCITANFTYESCAGNQQSLELVATGRISISIGEPSPQTLPASGTNSETHMVDVPTDVFYSSLKDVGYGYTGPFKALSDLKRKLGKASGSLAMTTAEYDGDERVLAVHPGVLDAAIHSIILAYSYPRDGQLWSLHLPTHIQRIRVNLSLCGRHLSDSNVRHVPFVATIPDDNLHAIDRSSGFRGDVEIHTTSGDYSAIQLEGLHVVPFSQATPADDRQVFYATHWVEAEPNADIPGPFQATAEQKKLAEILERGHYFYLRQLEQQIPPDHPGRSDKFNAAYLNWASHTHKLVLEGRHRYAKKEWLNDTLDDILALTAPYPDLPEVKTMHIVGEQMPRAIRGETAMLQHLMTTGILTDYYARALGMGQVTVLAETVQQVARRYPQARILEVGAGTGGATREILKRIGNEFGTYTFTDVSAGFFDDAQTEFAPYKNQMPFRVLDLEQDMHTQGFEKNSYDVVVGSLVLHTTKSLEQTLQRVRSLLKPGGYLIFYEITNVDLIRHTALFGCLPGWWQGMDEGRIFCPAVNESKWDALLRKTGFSGVDTMTPTHDSMPFCNSVLVSQAVDDWAEFMRQPLLAHPGLIGSLFSTGSGRGGLRGRSSDSVVKHLFIVGGSTFRVSRLIEDVQKLVHAFCDEITRVESLEELDHTQTDKTATVLVLQDLDQPVFRDMTESRLESLKKLFGSEKTVVWVTQNRLVDNPYSNMPAGFVRPSIWEAPELRYQFVDFQDVQGPRIDARALTEAVLRFQVSGSVHDPEPSKRDALWSVESEIIIDSDGRQLIPRLRPLTEANERYNSALRTINKEVDPQNHPVVLSNVDHGHRYVLHEQQFTVTPTTRQIVSLKVSHSSLRATKTALGDAVVVLGSCSTNGTQYLGLSDSPISLVDMPQTSLVPITSTSVLELGSEALFLSLVSTHLILPVFTENLTRDDTLVVHGAPPIVAALLGRHAELAGIKKVVFTTTSREEATKRNWVYVDRYLRRSQLKSLFPTNVSRFVDLTTETLEPSAIAACLPPTTHVVNTLSLFPREAAKLIASSTEVNEMLKRAVDSALTDLSTWQAHEDRLSIQQINVGDLAEKGDSSGDLSALAVIEWSQTQTKTLPVTVQPVRAQLKPNRTYWLVGLSRDMGLSLADWMIRNGARNLVITSRNPKVDQAWLDNAERRGATVRIMSNDLTDYDSLLETHRKITSTLPPIAGVAQGAMVLSDILTRDMTLDDLTRVMRPKVDGSLNLDRLFHDSPLDFFIFFSSAASVTGNAGQANYCAANFFMASLAQQRRRRGLAASVMDLGPVLGTGYITREIGDALTRPLAERGLLGMSESDVHRLFTEAINASRPDSEEEKNWQITTGLITLPADAPNRPLWYNFPHFACLTVRDSSAKDGGEASGSQAGAGAPIKDQLAGATSKEDVQRIITETFIEEMRNMLHMGDDYAITTAVRTDELGLDSLVAVRIRSWFLNHFQVNIPALKIMKGAPLQELIDQALEGIPDELTPNLKASGSPVQEGQSQQQPVPDIKGLSSSSEDSSECQSQESSSETGDSDSETPPPTEELELKRYGRLSYTQSVFMFVHELLNDKTTLNNTGIVHLRGEIRIHDLAKAIQTLGERHEALRTCFWARDNQLVQGVLETPTLVLEHRRIYTKEDVLNEYDSLRNTVFDLASGCTTRVVLLSISPRDHYFALATHHIMFDRSSTDIFMADLDRIYKNANDLSPNPLQYLDYSNQQHEQYSSGAWNEAINFWRREFSTIPDPLPLHRSRVTQRRPLERYASRTGVPESEFRIDAQLAGKIRQVARKYRSTPFHFHLAAFKVLLYRWLGTQDICIGIADGCRRDEYTWTGIGAFLNMLPLRMEVNSNQAFADAVVEAREKSLTVLSNAIPLEVILNELQMSRQATHTPLAQAFMNYAETSVENGRDFLGCASEMMAEDQAELPYDIAFTVINNTDPNGETETRIILNMQDSLYSDDVAVLIANGYEDILREFAERPEERVGDEWRYREPVLRKAVDIGQGPSFNSNWPETLVHRFEQLFPTIAQRVAITDSDQNSVTYGNLSRQVDVIASELLRKGVEPGSRVAVFQHPSVHWVASVVAILKIGAVYVPLDAGTPLARLSLIVGDCHPAAILVHGPTLGMTEKLETAPDTPIIDVSNLSLSIPKQVAIRAQADAPAIILYTSGSTGTPKGVILQHASLKHEFDHCAATYGLGEHDAVLQQSAWSFDLSVTQIFLALGVGARLHIVSHLLRADGRAMAELIRNEGLTATYATPTEYKSWLRSDHRELLRSSLWRLALVAGEAVTEPLLQLFRDVGRPEQLRLFNVYGPTETTCGSTKMELNYGTPGFYQGTVPVGRASANECFYILDEKLNLQPVGQAGEIAISGVGVAMGYLNNDERTRVSFLPDPFADKEYVRRGWTTMYRTGDVGFLRQDGTLVLRGRIGDDTEIKLNGVRIDLKDIEQTVLRAANGHLADAVASLRSNASTLSDDSETSALKFMIVHIIFSSGETAETADLSLDKNLFLQKLLEDLPLPRTMRPSALIPVDAFPRTVAGKLDRRALASLSIPRRLFDRTMGPAADSPLLSNAETEVRKLWQSVIPEELVGLHHIDAESDFFNVGGTSMLLIELQHKIREQFDVSITLLELFKASTLGSMSQLLQGDLGVEEKLSGDIVTSNQPEKIDWDVETALQPGLETEALKRPALLTPATPPRVIVLTGAAGFLGQHLLRALLDQEHVEKVICIATRNLTNERRKALFSSRRVECLEGDLRAPHLGLTQQDVTRIFETEADAVIHNGADVSHLKMYSSLRSANLSSTKDLVRMCLPRRVPLHYISTTGVTMYTTADAAAEVSVRDAPPPQDGRYGYVASKWASEIYLDNVNKRCGLPVYIHRPSSVLRPDIEGENPAADVLQNMLNYAQRIGAVPRAPGLKGIMDLVQPETVTEKVVGAVRGHTANKAGEGVVYIHESGDVELDVSEIRDYLGRKTGREIEEVGLDEWLVRAEEKGLSNAMAAVFSGLGDEENLNFPRLLKK